MNVEIDVNQWKWGLFVSILVGGVVTWLILEGLRKQRRVKKEKETSVWSPWITGFTERGFFTVAIALEFPGTMVAMIAWIGLKMATHWNLMSKDGGNPEQINLAFTALLAGLVSMFFAIVGGLISRSIEFSW